MSLASRALSNLIHKRLKYPKNVSNRCTGYSKRFFGSAKPESPQPDRAYFYWLSDRGRLYCIDRDEKKMPSGPAHLRDVKALNFFFSRIGKNDTGRHGAEFPWVSQCGKELNYIRSADETPIIFFDLQESSDNQQSKLIYGGDLTSTFDPSRIYVDEKTGRFYHPFLPVKPHLVGLKVFGLLSSNVAMQISPHLIHCETSQGLSIQWKHHLYPVHTVDILQLQSTVKGDKL